MYGHTPIHHLIHSQTGKVGSWSDAIINDPKPRTTPVADFNFSSVPWDILSLDYQAYLKLPRLIQLHQKNTRKLSMFSKRMFSESERAFNSTNYDILSHEKTHIKRGAPGEVFEYVQQEARPKATIDLPMMLTTFSRTNSGYGQVLSPVAASTRTFW